MSGRELIGYLTLSALVVIPAVFGLWQQNVYVQTRFEIESLRKERLSLQERYRCLRIERATLESLTRVGDEARKCGLVPREEASSPIFIFPLESVRPAGLAPGEAGARDPQRTTREEHLAGWTSSRILTRPGALPAEQPEL